MRSKAFLQVNDVTKSYGIGSRVDVIRNVAFTIYEREHTLILGMAGAGKSTLLRLILGATTPTTGVVRWRSPRPTMGFAEQMPRLTGRRTVMQYLRHACAFRDAAYRFGRCVAALQLEPILETRLGLLTPAQARRASLAAAFLSDSEVIVLDDAFAQLESLIRPLARSFITWSLAEESRHTVIACSQSLDDLRLPFARVIVMDKGRIVRDLHAASLTAYLRGEVLLMPAGLTCEAARTLIAARGATPDEVQIVRGEFEGSSAIIAGPFANGLLSGEDVRPLNLELILQLWQQPAMEVVRIRRLTNSTIRSPGLF